MAPRKKEAVVETTEKEVVRTEETVDELFFAEVERIPAKELFPQYDFNSYNNTVIKVKTPLREVIVNNCSEGYLLVPNNSVFPQLEEGLNQFGTLDIKREVRNFSSFFVDYNLFSEETKFKIKGTDVEVSPRISVQNSYNSKYLFQVIPCLYVEDTKSAMCLPVDDIEQIILSHCEGSSDEIEGVLEGIKEFLQEMEEIVDAYIPLVEQKVEGPVDVFVEKVLRGAKCFISFIEPISELLKAKNQTEYSFFDVYSQINFMLQPCNNPDLTTDPSTRRKMDEKILDYIFVMIEEK